MHKPHAPQQHTRTRHTPAGTPPQGSWWNKDPASWNGWVECNDILAAELLSLCRAARIYKGEDVQKMKSYAPRFQEILQGFGATSRMLQEAMDAAK